MATTQESPAEFTFLSYGILVSMMVGITGGQSCAGKVGERENQEQPRRAWGGLPAASPGTHVSLILEAGHSGPAVLLERFQHLRRQLQNHIPSHPWPTPPKGK